MNNARSFIDRVMGRFGYYKASGNAVVGNGGVAALRESSVAQYLQLLWAYYENNDLYDVATVALRQINTSGETLRGLRNPANRAVEFYAATICPGDLPDALPIVANNAKIIEPVQQLWGWSNWAEAKQVAVRHFAAYGNAFIKVAQRESGRPYLQVIRPDTVGDISTDERGYLTQCRIDTPIVQADRQLTRTEYWTPDAVRVWEHAKGGASIAELGTPLQTIEATSMGIDFVPIVHLKFKATGGTYGTGCFVHALDKIDELNRSAQRLNRMLFSNKAVWALLANSVDGSGRPLPAPTLKSPDGKTDLNIADIERDSMVRLPGASDLKTLVPNLPYADILAIVEASANEVRLDLPEVRFWDVIENADSGVAVLRKMAPAISRAVEARGNFENGLARAHAMALTLGANAGIFKNIGNYEAGDFEHTFARRGVLPENFADVAANEMALWQAMMAANDAGVDVGVSGPRLGLDEATIKRIEASNAQRNAATLAQNAAMTDAVTAVMQ